MIATITPLRQISNAQIQSVRARTAPIALLFWGSLLASGVNALDLTASLTTAPRIQPQALPQPESASHIASSFPSIDGALDLKIAPTSSRWSKERELNRLIFELIPLLISDEALERPHAMRLGLFASPWAENSYGVEWVAELFAPSRFGLLIPIRIAGSPSSRKSELRGGWHASFGTGVVWRAFTAPRFRLHLSTEIAAGLWMRQADGGTWFSAPFLELVPGIQLSTPISTHLDLYLDAGWSLHSVSDRWTQISNHSHTQGESRRVINHHGLDLGVGVRLAR